MVGVIDERFALNRVIRKPSSRIADSGSKRSLTFDPSVEHRTLATTVGTGTLFMGLRVGTLDQRAALIQSIQVFCR